MMANNQKASIEEVQTTRHDGLAHICRVGITNTSLSDNVRVV
jgi:hypothetical protein